MWFGWLVGLGWGSVDWLVGYGFLLVFFCSVWLGLILVCGGVFFFFCVCSILSVCSGFLQTVKTWLQICGKLAMA